VKPTYFRPGTLHEDDGVTSKRPSPAGDDWVLVDGTPASCVQIGLYYFFQERGPVDLVLSGPNYGRNTTACFALSSGTLGGALEAAVCKRKAIALSYAFVTREHDPKIIAGASRLSVKIVEHLVANWDANTDVYTVNVPLVPDVENKKIFWTEMLQNYWGPGSCFEAVEDTEDANEEEHKIREGEVEQKSGDGEAPIPHQHRNFKWSPRFTDVYKSVEDAPPGNDGWVVKEGFTR
jgi:tubulin--tyrosine ligase